MSQTPSLGTPVACRIVVQGALVEAHSERLAGLEVQVGPGEHGGSATTLVGRVADQAQLLGVLNGLYGLGYAVLSVYACPTRDGEP